MRVAIIGGGYAGMAAAVTLAECGVPVTVFEAADTLGGRARRVEKHGLALDNGQHLMIGAYRETLRLIRLVNPRAGRALFRMPLDWHIHGKFHLHVPRLPFSLGLLAGVGRAQGATPAEKLAALRFMLRQQRCKFSLGHAMSVAELLDAEGEAGAFREHLWEPLCLAALNTPPQLADAQIFLNVLRDGLSGGNGASDLLLARSDLSALFPEPAATYVRARGGEVLTGCTVLALNKSTEGLVVETASAGLEFSHVICALPPHRLALLACLPELTLLLERMAQFRYQPITTVYLQYPGSVCLPQPLLGLDVPHLPWCFDRGQLCGQAGLIAVVLSAVAPTEERPGEVLAQQLHRALSTVLPRLPQPLWHQVIAEKRATFSCEPGLERPPMKTALENFYLVGDYVSGDYPATLEGAVRSGVSAALCVLR
ncbi:MAG: hydroxysqualene dehydroxylase HpnE [Pseudomonadota bacterium]